jgi:hypothetical protein
MKLTLLERVFPVQYTSVAEPHNFDAVTDPDPGRQNDASPAKTPFPWFIHIVKNSKIYTLLMWLRLQ